VRGGIEERASMGGGIEQGWNTCAGGMYVIGFLDNSKNPRERRKKGKKRSKT